MESVLSTYDLGRKTGHIASACDTTKPRLSESRGNHQKEKETTISTTKRPQSICRTKAEIHSDTPPTKKKPHTVINRSPQGIIETDRKRSPHCAECLHAERSAGRREQRRATPLFRPICHLHSKGKSPTEKLESEPSVALTIPPTFVIARFWLASRCARGRFLVCRPARRLNVNVYEPGSIGVHETLASTTCAPARCWCCCWEDGWAGDKMAFLNDLEAG